jgi:hypothetical protein
MRVAGLIVTVVGLALFVGSAGAQAPPPTVTVTATETGLTVSPAGPLAAGPTRFDFVKAGGPPPEIAIAALRSGVTVDAFTAALQTSPDAAIELVHLDGGATLAPNEASRAVTFDLRPSSTYVALNLAGEQPTLTTFTTSGDSNGATAPQADARVRIVDLRFQGAKTLPRRGVVRFENAGWAPHFALAAPLKAKATKKKVSRAFLKNKQAALEKLLDFGRSIEAQSLITRGAVDFNELRFPKRGRYVMVCFFEGHSAQGMFRFVNVK